MSAVEEIQAAIDKVTKLKESNQYFEVNGWLCEGQPGDMVRDYFHPDGGATPLTNDPVIITLHRTIDAQLALLLECLDFYANSQSIGMPDSEMSEYYGNTLALARAINGVSS